jgi:hypothetical protein
MNCISGEHKDLTACALREHIQRKQRANSAYQNLCVLYINESLAMAAQPVYPSTNNSFAKRISSISTLSTDKL